MGYYTNISGEAIFEFRNQEEATWNALLVDRYYRNNYINEQEGSLNVKTNIKQEENFSLNIEGKVLRFEANVDLKRFRDVFFMPLYFLGKQSKTILYCDILARGEEFGDVYKLSLEDEGEIMVTSYDVKCDHAEIKKQSEWNKFDVFIKNFVEIMSVTRTAGYMYGNYLDSSLFPNSVVSLGSEKVEISGYDLSELILRFLYEYPKLADSVIHLAELGKFKNIEKQHFNEDDIKFNKEDIEKILTNDSELDNYNPESEGDLIKLHKIMTLILTAIKNKLVKKENDSIVSFFSSMHDDNGEGPLETNLEMNNSEENITVELTYLETGLIRSIEEFFHNEFVNFESGDVIENYRKNHIYSIFAHLQIRKDVEKEAEILKLCEFEGDFYEYSKQFPSIQLTETLEIPMNPYFLSIFNSYFVDKEHDLTKLSDGEYSIINPVSKKGNEKGSICDSCINRIRKRTMGCDNCFDFDLLNP